MSSNSSSTGKVPFGRFISCFRGPKEVQSILPAPAVSPVPLMQNNMPKWYIWGEHILSLHTSCGTKMRAMNKTDRVFALLQFTF